MMMSAGKLVVLLLLLVLGLLCSRVSGGNVHVSIRNSLGNGEVMSLHCQSKDNDLGNQTVAEGSEYGWDFSPNVWGTTLFFCDIMGSWRQLLVSEYHFVAYAFARDRVRCQTHCSWLISKEGLYGLNGQTGLWEFMYNWPT